MSVHDLGDAGNLKDLPQEYQDAIVSTRVRVGRTVKGYPMAGKLTKEVSFEVLIYLVSLKMKNLFNQIETNRVRAKN